MDRLFPIFIEKQVPGVSPLVQAFVMVLFNALFLFVYAAVITAGIRLVLL